MVKNEKNLEYLQKLLGHLGFGDKLNGVLESAISRELPKFTLGISNVHRPLSVKEANAPRTDYVQYELNFNRGKEGDAYFLNTVGVTLHKTGESVPRTQTFDVERDHRITAVQAFKLLSGLSFEKDIYVKPKGAATDADRSEKIPAWFKLNLDITDANGNHPLRTMRPEYGFDLATALAKYPLKGMDQEPQLADALKSLRSGNYVEAGLISGKGKKEQPVLIAANPQMKTIDIYDRQLREIRDEDIWPEKAAGQLAKTTVVQHQEAGYKQGAPAWEQEETNDNTQRVGR